MRPLILAAACLALAACNGDRDDGTKATIDANSGSVSIDTPVFKGKVKLPEIDLSGSDLDFNGVKLPAGSKVGKIDLDTSKNEGDGRFSVDFHSPETPAAVRNDLLTRLNRDAKFDVKADGDGLTGKTDDGKPFTLRLTPGGDGTDGTIVIG